MFYESREFAPVDFATVKELVSSIKEGKLQAYQAANFKTSFATYWFVSDVHIDDANFSEVALILEKDGVFYQLDSISFSHCSVTKILSLVKSHTSKKEVPKNITQLIIGEASTLHTGWFTCDCCGSDFKSSILKQKKFDKDTGYGMCPSCE